MSVLVSDVSPWSGPQLGGTLVTLVGGGLGDVELSCRFGDGSAVEASLHGAEAVRCVSPVAPLTGWSSVELVSHGETLRSGGSFFYHARMWVSAVAPLLGPVEGGTRLTLLGAHFREAATLRCRFEESSSTVVARYVDSSQLECATPVQAGASPRAVEVSMNAQQFSESGVSFTYVSAALVSSVWPSRGVSEGGTPVTVYGANLDVGSESRGYLQCRVNSTVVRAELLGAEALVCNSTGGASGVLSVEVTSNGRDFSASGAQFELVSVLVSDVTPWSGPELGGTLVTLVGVGFDDVEVSCRFGGEAPVLASVHGAESLRCVSPLGVSTGWSSVELVSHGETLRSGGSFFYHARMRVSS
ncbi:MAG: IPT/TIG domain-containing protein, partial [Actinomycetota bacterium]|nr:IPT/TIG domain-containing protein [Actinomycetota bacterium]